MQEQPGENPYHPFEVWRSFEGHIDHLAEATDSRSLATIARHQLVRALAALVSTPYYLLIEANKALRSSKRD